MVIIILTIDGYKNLNAYRHTFKSELYKDSTRVMWNSKKYDFSTRITFTVSLEIVCCQTQKIKTPEKNVYTFNTRSRRQNGGQYHIFEHN